MHANARRLLLGTVALLAATAAPTAASADPLPPVQPPPVDLQNPAQNVAPTVEQVQRTPAKAIEQAGALIRQAQGTTAAVTTAPAPRAPAPAMRRARHGLPVPAWNSTGTAARASSPGERTAARPGRSRNRSAAARPAAKVSHRRVAHTHPRTPATAHPRARDDGLDASGFPGSGEPTGMALLGVLMAFLLLASRRLNGGRLLPF